MERGPDQAEPRAKGPSCSPSPVQGGAVKARAWRCSACTRERVARSKAVATCGARYLQAAPDGMRAVRHAFAFAAMVVHAREIIEALSEYLGKQPPTRAHQCPQRDPVCPAARPPDGLSRH